MADITEIAVAAWRLEKWLDNVNVERKMAAKSALRSIKRYLQENEIEVIDLTGAGFDVGLAVSVVNNESSETDEDKLIIREMVKPIVKEKGSVIQYGQVILGDEVKQPKENNVVEDGTAESPVGEVKNILAELEKNPEDSQPDDLKITEESETLADEEGRREPRDKHPISKIKILAWLSVIALQAVILALLLQTRQTLNAQVQYDNVSETVNVPEISEAGQTETDIINIVSEQGDKLRDISSQVDGIDSALQEMNLSMAEVLEYIETKKESESNSKELAETTEGEDDPKNDYILYTVKAGDNLIAICSEYNIDFYTNKDEIMELNGIVDPSIIIIGQELKLPCNK